MDKTASLLPEVADVLRNKATESPYSCEFHDKVQVGSYLCRGCGAVLFRGDQQFVASCGWPSFDTCCEDAVVECDDVDGYRTEILCRQCDGHLGHVFRGEGYTARDQRYCVNGLSLEFVADKQVQQTQEAIIAGGCFWGVEALMGELPGVLITEVGYTGGHVPEPDYDTVCHEDTGHLEALRIVFDPQQCSYEALLKRFFEIHDPTQLDQQGPDRGTQYRSAVFYYDEQQYQVAHSLMEALRRLGYDVVTDLLPVSVFWPAETYHQGYYEKQGGAPYCHVYQPRFE